MQIQCKIHRKGGSKVEVFGTTYHFKPNDKGHHVADVTNDKHTDRLLAIPEAYRIYRGEDVTDVNPGRPVDAAPPTAIEQKKPDHPGTMLLGSSVHPAIFDIAGKQYQLGAVVGKAQIDSELTPEQWNALSEDERHDAIDDTLDLIKGKLEQGEHPGIEPLPTEPEKEPAPEANADSVERAELVKQYEAKFGKKPNHRMGIEKLKAELAKAE